MAKLKYTFDDYITNPSGKGAANSISPPMVQFEKELMSLESKNDKAKFKVYKHTKTGGKHVFYIHFQIPSSTKGFFNDVVIEFTEDDNDTGNIKTIKNYNAKFFSNDTNFVYTYAYTFKSHGLLINDLEKRLPLRCLLQKPTMRNPDNAMGLNKALCYSYIIMNKERLFEKDVLNRIVISGGLSKLYSEIPDFSAKQRERSEIEQKLKEQGIKQKQPPSSKIIKSKNLLGNTSIETLKPKITKVVASTKKSITTKKVKKR
jgi:hypothetical protein